MVTCPQSGENVERIVVHIRVLAGKIDYFATLGTLHVPNWRRRASHQDQKYASEVGVLWKIFFGDFVFPLSWRTIFQRNLVSLRMCADAAAETTSHPHQMSIVQIIIRTHQLSPPGTEAARTLSHAKVGIEDNSIHTVICVVLKVYATTAVFIQCFC